MGVDSRSGADIAFDAGPDCLFLGAAWCILTIERLARWVSRLLVLAAAFSGMVNAKYAPSFSPPID